MFEKNDKTLHIYYVLIHVALVLFLVAFIAVGIVFMVDSSSALIGIGILVGGIILTLIMYVVARAIFGLFIDIKLIRNKLYNTDNAGFEKYYRQNVYAPDGGYAQAAPSPAPSAAPQAGKEDKYSRIEKLKAFRDKGVISEAEFQNEKRAILAESEPHSKNPIDG